MSLTEQEPRRGRLDVLLGIGDAAAVPSQQPEMGLGEHAARSRGLLFEPQQALELEREALPRPHTAHCRGRDAHTDQAQLLADPHVAVGRKLGGHLEDFLHELGPTIQWPREFRK